MREGGGGGSVVGGRDVGAWDVGCGTWDVGGWGLIHGRWG